MSPAKKNVDVRFAQVNFAPPLTSGFNAEIDCVIFIDLGLNTNHL